jgi:hypothetical protein
MLYIYTVFAKRSGAARFLGSSSKDLVLRTLHIIHLELAQIRVHQFSVYPRKDALKRPEGQNQRESPHTIDDISLAY